MVIHRLKIEEVRVLEKTGDVARISAEMRAPFRNPLEKVGDFVLDASL
jgi:hypothetical protein